jgi:membrane protein implicated in regulation of membrane protease activity
MCACGCLILAGVVATLVYAVMHGLWLLVAAAVAVSLLIAWLGRKMFSSSTSRKGPLQK